MCLKGRNHGIEKISYRSTHIFHMNDAGSIMMIQRAFTLLVAWPQCMSIPLYHLHPCDYLTLCPHLLSLITIR
ncbi:MAG: hypothetical protein DRN37_00590 [Thermoplasmata archaeon]|nr:MAG: hypothetical protein DRN37_00590 [Thermoplasmata archaeon]